jgi:ATP-binding cassette subfamily C (CFTR/MRP) protein 1
VSLEIVGACILLLAALYAVFGRDSISPAIAALSLTYALQVSQTLRILVRMTAEMETNIVAVERIEEYSTVPQEAAWIKEEIVWTTNF